MAATNDPAQPAGMQLCVDAQYSASMNKSNEHPMPKIVSIAGVNFEIAISDARLLLEFYDMETRRMRGRPSDKFEVLK